MYVHIFCVSNKDNCKHIKLCISLCLWSNAGKVLTFNKFGHKLKQMYWRGRCLRGKSSKTFLLFVKKSIHFCAQWAGRRLCMTCRLTRSANRGGCMFFTGWVQNSKMTHPTPKKCHTMGPFKNHVDNRGWVGGPKFVIFVHVLYIRNVHGGRWVIKNEQN